MPYVRRSDLPNVRRKRGGMKMVDCHYCGKPITGDPIEVGPCSGGRDGLEPIYHDICEKCAKEAT
jgi:hypothetical protein